MPKLLSNQYLPDDDKWRKATDDACDEERDERQRMIERLWKYYWGQHPRFLTTEDGMDHNVVLNLCQMAVDKKVSFLLSDTPSVTLPQPEGQPDGEMTDDPTLEALELWLEENDFDAFLMDMALSGFVTGHTFIKLYLENDVPYFALLDPCQVTVFWQHGAQMTAAWYRIQWGDHDDTQHRQDVVPSWMLDANAMNMTPEYWVIIDYEKGKSSIWKETARDVWNYPFAPVVDWKNKYKPFHYYGDSEISHHMLNDAVNFLASNNNKIIYYHGSPRVVAKNVRMPRDPETGEQLPTSPNDIMEIEGEGAEMYLLEPRADLVASMNLLEKFQNFFFTQAKVIDLATIQDKLGQITNFGVKMMFSDMLADLRQKRQLYGKGLGWLMVYGMAILGAKIPLPIIEWADPLPENMLEKAQIAQIEKNIGTASTQTLSEELGHDWATEEERLATDNETSATALDRVMQGQGQFLGMENRNGANNGQ